MTTKTISGTYSAGYSLKSSYNAVTITSSGSVGGTGLVVEGLASVTNFGHLEAGAGHYGVTLGDAGDSLANASSGYIRGGAGATGEAGGYGVFLQTNGAISDNLGAIVGGAGAADRTGGYGVRFGGVGYMRNSGLVRGGAGGADGTNTDVNGGGAGIGCTGIGTIVNYTSPHYYYGRIYGGVGGRGAYGIVGGDDGGFGGGGVYLRAGGFVDNYQGAIVGAAGGAGGGTGVSGQAGLGGKGGYGVLMANAGTLVNSGAITGGAGGAGGGAGGVHALAGDGGVGGAGVNLNFGDELSNFATIRGGAGGAAGAGGSTTASSGKGGYGAYFDNGKVFNYGSIVGGIGGAGGRYGGPGDGVESYGTTTIVNGSSADTHAFIGAGSTAANGIGVYAFSGSALTLTNFGTISGNVALKFSDVTGVTTNSDTLVVEAGCAFIGAIEGGGGTLELASGAGTVSAFGFEGLYTTVSGSMATTTFQDFATLEIGAGASFTLAAGADVQSTATITDTLVVAGAVTIAATLAVEGLLDVDGKLSGVRNSVLNIDGGTVNLNKGTALTVPVVDVSGAAQVTLATSLPFKGVWDQSGGTLTIDHAKTLTLTGSGSTFSGLVTEVGKGIADIRFAPTAAAATQTLNGVTINALRVTAANTTFIVGSGGATITATASLDFSTTSSGITGASAADILTLNGGMFGDGSIGEGRMGLVVNGQIQSEDLGSVTTGLIINTGSGEDINNGVIFANSTGGITIQSTIVNNGQLLAEVGTLTLDGAVSGTGSAQVSGGTIDAVSTFNQAVFFTTTGTLELSQSQGYTGSITGFSKTGSTSLDLADIGFVSSTEATFSGTTTSGVLTVTDGTHTAHITLIGNYTNSSFIASSDGHGGTIVIDPRMADAPPPPAAAPSSGSSVPPHQLIAAMAGLGAGSGATMSAHAMTGLREMAAALLTPRVAIA